MLAERWQQIESLYHAACEREPRERRAYLDSACGGDEELRREVESLLSNDEPAAKFLETDPASSESHPPRLPSGEQIGPYVVVEFLRAGGMGEVYKARDTRLGRSIAIKFLPRACAADPAALGRFQREARAASALNHPRICTIHDLGEYQGRPFLVMELLEGQSLRDRLLEGPVPASLLVDWAVQICDALAAAHTKGIVHRDIKPANIFVMASGQVKILDFGLAKLSSEPAPAYETTGAATNEMSETLPGIVAGTVAYMSPEQVRMESLDARTDLFSLGVTLYEVATGGLPFPGSNLALIREAILKRLPAPPRRVNPAIPEALETILLKALQKNSSDRYSNAAEMRRDLEGLRLLPSHRGRWWAAIAATVAVAVGVTAAGKSIWFAAPHPRGDTTQRRVTANPPEDPVMQASLSPDGRTVAYSDFAGIHLRRMDTGETRLIAPPDQYCYR